jgi:hypothetical protein
MKPSGLFELQFGNEGYSKVLAPHGVEVTDGKAFPYKNGQQVALTFRFSAENYEVEIDGKHAFGGKRLTSDSIQLTLSAGDNWSKGTTEFWDFRLEKPVAGQASAINAPATTQPASVAGSDGKSPAALYLQTAKNPDGVSTPLSLLGRELYRQALLIAARDGLGLQTRDESLREWSGAAPAAAWNLVPALTHVRITDGAGADIWRHDEPKKSSWPEKVFEHTAEFEALSRADYIKLLQAHGFSGTGNATRPGAAAPADAEARLGEFEELSQFAVLRETHELVRKDGESEARLGVLVRAYANLGQMTRFHWSIEHQVFAARSLLYAQRMVSNDPKSAAALWHRAYAMAMAGFQAQTLKDLEAAKQIGGEAKAPAWVPLLAPFCNYDLGRLSDLSAADRSRAPLAMYLAFLTVERSGCQAATLNTEKAALELNPRCLRLIDAMCDQTGPGLLNELVEEGPRIFSTTLGSELEKMSRLPQAVIGKVREARRPGGNPEGRETVCQSLIEQGAPENDPLEPSWAALGRRLKLREKMLHRVFGLLCRQFACLSDHQSPGTRSAHNG